MPGTGAYAILTTSGQGCVTAPVGSQNTAYSNAVSGISMFIALAFLPLAASLLFLKKDSDYSIYPKKWVAALNEKTDANNLADPNIITTSAAANSSLTRTPSIYDLISVAQWIVTTALFSLPNLPAGYRQFASNFGWSTGAGGGISVQSFSGSANDMRLKVCHNLNALCNSTLPSYDTCKPWFNSDVTPNHLFSARTTDGGNMNFKDPTGFESYSNTLHIPHNNIFFVMFVALILAILVTLIIMLFVGIVAFKMKEKLKVLKKVSQNMRSIVFGKSRFFCFFYSVTI